MKKYSFLSLLLLCIGFSSFSTHKGGDVFTIYLNGKQVCRQFVLVDKSIKTLQLDASNANDKIEISYSHCGRVGTSRVLTFRNEQNEPVKELKFPDASKKQSFMGFYCKYVAKNENTKLNVYYSAKELPEGRLLTTLQWNDRKVIAEP